MTLKIDLKVKAISTDGSSWTIIVETIFLYLTYILRYSGTSIKMAHPVYITRMSGNLCDSY